MLQYPTNPNKSTIFYGSSFPINPIPAKFLYSRTM
jgi:hypothetical protein